MDSIRITFAAPLTEAGLSVSRYNIRELENLLSSRLVAELEEQIAKNEFGKKAFQDLLANAVHLRWNVKVVESTHFEIIAAPLHRLAGAFDYSTDLCSLWLGTVAEDWIREKLGPGFAPFEVDYPNSAALEPYAVRSTEEWKSAKSSVLFRRIAMVLFLLIIGTLGFTLFKIYRMVDDVNRSYTEIESTVDRKTEEIMDKIEKGITTSDRVVNMVDKVKNLVIPTDSSKRSQE